MIAKTLKTLPNGLRVVAVNMPHLHSAEVALYIKVGGRDDPKDKPGLAHFLEHMIFRGTAEYPTSLDIETAFETIGGAINASTDEECTCFFSRVHPDHMAKGVEILSSMILRPTLTDIEIEKKIITEEALDDLSQSGEEINPHNLASRLLWPEHQLGNSTIGTLESIASFTASDLKEHLATFYLPDNAVLIAAGRFDTDCFIASVDQWFSPWKESRRPPVEAPQATQTSANSVFVADSDSQAHLQISFRGYANGDNRILPLRILRRILCGSGGARLNMNLREQLGIVYSVDANITAYAETGYFSIELSTSAESLTRAVSEVFNELLKVSRDGVDQAELDRVKQVCYYELEYSKDSCFEMQIRFGWGELMGVVREVEDDLRQTSSLTVEELRQVAADLFRPERLNLVVVGDWSDNEKKAVEREITLFTENFS